MHTTTALPLSVTLICMLPAQVWSRTDLLYTCGRSIPFITSITLNNQFGEEHDFFRRFSICSSLGQWFFGLEKRFFVLYFIQAGQYNFRSYSRFPMIVAFIQAPQLICHSFMACVFRHRCSLLNVNSNNKVHQYRCLWRQYVDQILDLAAYWTSFFHSRVYFLFHLLLRAMLLEVSRRVLWNNKLQSQHDTETSEGEF